MPVFQGFLMFSSYCGIWDYVQGRNLLNVLKRFGTTVTVGYVYDQIVTYLYRKYCKSLALNEKKMTTGLNILIGGLVIGFPIAWHTRKLVAQQI